jgi:hypothetical protein
MDTTRQPMVALTSDSRLVSPLALNLFSVEALTRELLPVAPDQPKLVPPSWPVMVPSKSRLPK